MAHILISPLSWGLGHATRDLPIIRELLRRGHTLTFAAVGAAASFLRKECPDCRLIALPDYPAPYTKTRFYIAKFLAYGPAIVGAIKKEHAATEKIIAETKPDLIISDNRFGIYSPDIPSFFISHQLRFAAPRFIPFAEEATQAFNSGHHGNFRRIIVPDNRPETVSLSGKLSVSTRPVTKDRVYYAGILSSIKKLDVAEDIDYLISISGPEPQRTELEKIILSQVMRLPGKKIVLLGKPAENTECRIEDGTVVKSHAGRKEMSLLMNRARFIISRSGYTTMMEIAELGKKRCLFIPTPQQTEQEYLSQYYMEKGWFYSQSQYTLDLGKDVIKTKNYSGFPSMPRTEANARRLYDDLFAEHLDQ